MRVACDWHYANSVSSFGMACSKVIRLESHST